jgi:hypothetical protein
MTKFSKCTLSLLISTFCVFAAPQKANASIAPAAFGWYLGEMIYGYPQWPFYYKWRVKLMEMWPVAHRYYAPLSIGPYQRYEIQVTTYGRVSVIGGYSNFGSLAGCKAAQLALAPDIESLARVNKIGFYGPGYNVTASCTLSGMLGYQVAYNVAG